MFNFRNKIRKGLVIGLLPFYLFTFLTFLTACSDDDTPQLDFRQTELPTLNTLSQDVMYVYNNPNPKYTFTWTSARFFLDNSKSSTSIGGYTAGGVIYELECDLVGNDFTGPISAGSVTSLNSLTIDAAQLASAVDATYPQTDSIANLEFRLKTKFGDTDTTIVYSKNTITATLNWTGKPASPGPQHEGPFKVYVDDQTGWAETALYIWTGSDAATFNNDLINATYGWPGQLSTRTETIGGTTYKVWELPDLFQQGTQMHFIFNNNGNGVQIDDVLSDFQFSEDVYLRLKADNSFERLGNPYKQTVRLYLKNTSGWAETYLYMWGNGADLVDPWPGFKLEGGQTVTMNGETWQEYYLPAAYVGQGDAHLIFNNNNGSQFDAQQGITLDHDLGVKLSDSGASEAKLPGRIFVFDKSGWDALALYAWSGDGTINDQINAQWGWPGIQPVDEVINGYTWKVFVMPDIFVGNPLNYIFNNNNGGLQFDAMGGYSLEGELFVEITGNTYKEISF